MTSTESCAASTSRSISSGAPSPTLIGFCDVIFGWDIGDVLYDNASVTGWHTGYPDIRARVDLSTFRVLPWEPDTACFLLDFITPDGSPHPACPRGLLKQVIAKAKALGYEATLAAEFEFFLFKESAAGLHAKGFRGLDPLSPGMYGYSWVREGQNADLCHAILDDMAAFDIPIEGLHTETGPGVYEVAIQYDSAVRAADKGELFKTIDREAALRALGLLGDLHGEGESHSLPGSSGHISPVAPGKNGKNVFHDPSAADGLSSLARHYVGGQVALMPEVSGPRLAHAVNTYKRSVPGVRAPLNASWGFENRTCAIRAIPGSPKSTLLEYRQTAADINPYIAMALVLAAGLWGIEQKKDPPIAPVKGDAGERADLAKLPTNLRDAVTLLGQSKTARLILGDAFVDHYVRTRDWEWRQYEKAVTDWELSRYFEAI